MRNAPVPPAFAPCVRAYHLNQRAAFAEQQFLSAASKFRNPVNAEIVFRRFIFQ